MTFEDYIPILWSLFDQYFPGFITETEIRAPLNYRKRSKYLDLCSFNKKAKRYERFGISLSLSDGVAGGSFRFSIGAFPFPNFYRSEFGWEDSLYYSFDRYGSEEISDLSKARFLEFGSNPQVVSQNVEACFKVISPTIFKKMDEEWERIEKSRFTQPVISAVAELQRKHGYLGNPKSIPILDIVLAFANAGLPLREIPESVEAEYNAYVEEITRRLPGEKLEEFKIRGEMISAQADRLGMKDHGILEFRWHILRQFKIYKNKTVAFDPVLSEICYELSKSGVFYSWAEHNLQEIAETVEKQYVIEVYEYFRDTCQRYEDEWRDQFVSFFPGSSEYLPAIQYHSDHGQNADD